MPDRETLVRMYEKHGSSMKVGEALGVGISTVTKWMRKQKIPMKRMMRMSDREKLDVLEYHINTLKM